MSHFSDRVDKALANDNLSEALKKATSQLVSRRSTAFSSLEDAENLRDIARNTKMKILHNLEDNLLKFEKSLQKNGSHVHWAKDAEEANNVVIEIAQKQAVKKIVKSKSMLSEEIHLNTALIKAGLQVVETDLGEYIVQLAGDKPSHIIAPIIHMTREDVGNLMHDRLSVPFSDEPEVLTRIARRKLRQEFLDADMGITGANFGVVETGSICLVTNEGNARMVTTLPKIHVVLIGIEKLVATFEDLNRFLKLLARSATGQKLSVYTSIIQGPGKGTETGPEEVHVVLVDNGRSGMLGGDLAESLACIRCGACLNVCPIYKNIGGHAYGDTYAGPIGSIITPGLRGLAQWHELPAASTLCGACKEVCPVRIDIPKMLLKLRQDTPPKVKASISLRMAIKCFAVIAGIPKVYKGFTAFGSRLLRFLGSKSWLTNNIPLLGRWTKVRDFKTPAKKSFQSLWQEKIAKDGK